MSTGKVCPAEVLDLHGERAAQASSEPEEKDIIKGLLLGLDARDGLCDGVIDTSVPREDVVEHIESSAIEPSKKEHVLSSFWRLYSGMSFDNFMNGPYRDVVEMASKNVPMIDILLGRTEPSLKFTESLKEKAAFLNSDQPESEQFYSVYSDFVDELYAESGLPLINRMIEEAEHQKKSRERTSPSSMDEILVSFGTLTEKDKSISALFDKFSESDFLGGLNKFSESALPLLYEHKRKAEELFVRTIEDEIALLKDECAKDPTLYWIPLMSLIGSDSSTSIEKTYAHAGLAYKLYSRTNSYALNETDKIFFEIEYFDRVRLPLAPDVLKKRSDQILGIISSVKQSDPEYQSKLQKYYSTLARVWYHRYLGAAEAFDPKIEEIVALEDELREMMRLRRDHPSRDEAGIYLDNVNMIASVWTDRDGLIKHRLWTQGLPSARSDIMRLATITKEAESVANGWLHVPGGEDIKDVVADIRWKVNGESYIRAGLSKQGLQNIDSEQITFRSTMSYFEHLQELEKRYPWLVKNGRITFDSVGEKGEEARSISRAAFLKSASTGREVGFPLVLGIVGSAFTPVGTVVGSAVGKGINEIINLTDDDVKEMLSNSEQTGIPLISKDLADQLNSDNTKDWLFNAASSLLMFRFSRSLLSIGRGSVEASFDFIKSGAFVRMAGRGARATLGAIKNVPTLPSRTVAAVARGGTKTVGGFADLFRVSIPRFVTRSVPNAFSMTGALEKYGSAGLWSRTKFLLGTAHKGWLGFWNKWGVPIQMTGGVSGMAYDYLPDKKFNGWSGPLGASLLINVTYGPLIWGWNPNGGMAGFAWRYGFELIAQSAQGQDVSTPDMAYTTFGMFMSYTLRGVNKLGSLGRPIVKDGPILKRFAHFTERRDVLVPQSVVGTNRMPGRWGMVRGDVLRLGKPEKMSPAYLRTVRDGHVLKVTIDGMAGKTTRIKILRKATSRSGSPIVSAEIREVPMAGRMGRWFSNTTYPALKDAAIYRIPDKVIRPATMALANRFPKLKGLNEWWTKLGERVPTAEKPIFNFRGSLANSQFLPLIGIGGALGGILQGSDPKYTGALRMGDYGGAYFFQHKFQHLLTIDSFWGNMLGYALGVPAQKWVLPYLFPSMINKAPGLGKKDGGYFVSLEKGELDKANDSIKGAITSYCVVHNVPLLGDLWNEYGPFGKVEDSNRRIEEAGALAFWGQMYEKVELAEKDIQEDFEAKSSAQDVRETLSLPTPNMNLVTNFVKKIVRDHEEYVLKGNVPEDPVMLRLHVLEMAFLKVMISDKSHPFVAAYAERAASGIAPMLDNVPELHNYDDVKRFATGLNENILVDLD